MLTFPNIEPNLPSASNSSNSYKEDFLDSTIITETDSLYKKTRPRTTRLIGKWSFSWVGLTNEEYVRLMDFYKKVGKAEMFTFVNPIDGKNYIVRIVEKGSWQWYYHGWQGSFTFEEV